MSDLFPLSPSYLNDLSHLEDENFDTLDVLSPVLSSSTSFHLNDNVCFGEMSPLGCGVQQSGEGSPQFVAMPPQNNSVNKQRSLIQRRNVEVLSPLVLNAPDLSAQRPRTPVRATSSNQRPASALTVPAAQKQSSWTRVTGELTHSEFASVEIRFRSRREGFRPMEDALYSTIKYELHHVGVPAGLPVRIQMDLMKQHNNERVMPREALAVEEQDATVPGDGTITMKNKLQFKTISHRHQQASFYLLVTYEHERTGEVFLRYRSIPFKVYARRPDVKVPSSRRLKKHRGLSTDELMAQKARKVGKKSKRDEGAAKSSVKQAASQEPLRKKLKIDSFASELDNLWCAMERIIDDGQREAACKMLLSISSRIG